MDGAIRFLDTIAGHITGTATGNGSCEGISTPERVAISGGHREHWPIKPAFALDTERFSV
jgi:hypothetical protein